MLRATVFLLTLVFAATSAYADRYSDCHQYKGDTDHIKNPDLPIRACTQIIESGRESRKNLSIAYYHRGSAYYQKIDYDRAGPDFDKAIELDPNNVDAYIARGYVDLDDYDGDSNPAIADFDKAIELGTKRSLAFYGRAAAYQDQGEYDRAIADYTKTIALKPEQSTAYSGRADSYAGKGEYDRAIVDYHKAIELSPKWGPYYGDRELAYEKKGERDKAIADFRKALELDPSDELDYKEGLKRLGAAPKKTNAAAQKKDGDKTATITGTSQEMELSFWDSVKDSDDPAMLQAYLDQFPKGTFAALAKIKLKKAQ